QDGNSANQDFIPANLGIGFGLEMDIDKFNEINVYFDVNKLLVPTPKDSLNAPDSWDKDLNGVPDSEESSQIAGLFTSFGDAPGGFSEEMAEFTIGGGVEYVYNNLFMARLGYFYEAPSKGSRRFLTAGAGIKYSVFTLNAAYIIPTSKPPGPLDNTMYFSLLFDFNSGGKKAAATPKDIN
ncbi:MAG: PorV/PorQ family protein, partial [Chitinophagales bacterium]